MRLMESRPYRDSWRAAMLAIIAFVACFGAPLAAAKTPSPAPSEIRLDALPSEAREAIERIRTGGPLPYSATASCSAIANDCCRRDRAAIIMSTP